MKTATLKTTSPSKFNKLSNYRKRMLIAADVIGQIKAKKLIPLREYMIRIGGANPRSDKSLKESIDAAKNCKVCAKGAVICSLVGRYNTVTGGDADDMYHAIYTDKEELDTRKIFGKDLWQELECQFEGDAAFRTEKIHSLLGSNYATPVAKKTLTSLMQNLIDNNGKLKVKDKLID